jgi:AAA+ superfamily predicted ATPase
MSASGLAVIVGQAAQLLRKSLATARRSQPCIVVVDALPRIGKSTLLRSPTRRRCVEWVSDGAIPDGSGS